MRPVRDVISALLVASAAASVLVACASAATLAAPRQVACRPPGGHTLASDRAVRVYSLRGVVYGCVNATGALQNLGGAGFCNQSAGRVGPVRLAGPIVAYGVETCGVDTASSAVLVADLASGAKLADVPATTLRLGPESFVSVASLVLRRDGAVGWIADTVSIVGGHGATFEVHRFARGKGTLLDSGRAIGSGSLRLVGARMSWRHGSATRSARLT